jgi:hypothetical protein
VISFFDTRTGRPAVAKRANNPDPAPEPEPDWPELSSRHRHTLHAVYENPTRGDIPWRSIEALFRALGGTVQNAKGSRRRVKLGPRKAVFHEPHPEKETDKGAVESVRGFLASAGVRP